MLQTKGTNGVQVYLSIALLSVVVPLALTAVAQQPPDVWTQAEQKIVRLPAERFPNAPEKVRKLIEEQGCLVPQPGDRVRAGEAPVNVASGAFAVKGQLDWAVLCSRKGRSSIIVLWGGAARCESPFAEDPDKLYLQSRGGDLIDYSREIGAASPAVIRSTYRILGETPPKVSHDAIDDFFVV
jgi:hypothetical protein